MPVAVAFCYASAQALAVWIPHWCSAADPFVLKTVMRILLLIILLVAIVLLLRKLQDGRRRKASPSDARPPERMVECAHCGVNHPVSDSVLSQGKHYCSDAHRQASTVRRN